MPRTPFQRSVASGVLAVTLLGGGAAAASASSASFAASPTLTHSINTGVKTPSLQTSTSSTGLASTANSTPMESGSIGSAALKEIAETLAGKFGKSTIVKALKGGFNSFKVYWNKLNGFVRWSLSQLFDMSVQQMFQDLYNFVHHTLHWF